MKGGKIQLLILLCLLVSPCAWAGQTVERVLKFPQDVCYGQLLNLAAVDSNITKGGFEIHDQQSRLGAAQGVVRLRIRSNVEVCFEPNRKLYQNPSALKLFPAQGIDAVRIQFIAQDDSELPYCDRLLSYIGHLQSLSKIKVTNSDASDKGLASIGPLPHLRDLQAGATSITGKSLPVIAKYAGLEGVVLSRVNLKGSNIGDLAPLKHLTSLNVHASRIGNAELKNLGQISSLKFLKLDGNPDVDDRCLVNFRGLKKLEILDVTGTAITASGLATHLKGLPLSKLFLNGSRSIAADKAKLAKALPKCEIVFPRNKSEKPGELVREVFAPLH